MQSGAQNAVVGDMDESTKLPETQVPEDVLTEEKKMAQYSESAEFKRLREFMEARVHFYQRYLPNGQQVEGDPVRVGLPQGVPAGQLESYWIAACVIIKEFENVLGEYDRAREAVKDAGRQN